MSMFPAWPGPRCLPERNRHMTRAAKQADWTIIRPAIAHADCDRQETSMMSSRKTARAAMTLFALVAPILIAPDVAGQTNTSSIAGVVKDTSGAVLPGVTVEASSPALIERTRSAITDS